MAKNRMVAKHCPKCEQQVPVACKSCPCGHEFFANRKSRSADELSSRPRRRTERVRKERQSYLTALVLEQRAAARAKRARRNGNRRGRPPTVRSSSHDSADEGRKLNRPRCGPPAKPPPAKPIEPEMPDEEEEDVFAGCSEEQLELYATILADINRKLSSQLFQHQL